MASLPKFIPPMLAKHVEPFDSEAHFFEVKWDGIRALAFLEGECTRLLSRRETPLLERYPELEFLRDLESGAVLDGEIVLFTDGRPDIQRLLSRQQGKSSRAAVAKAPVTYIVFDLLYVDGDSLLDRPLKERRTALREYVNTASQVRLVFSDGVTGAGRTLFEQTSAQGLEGVVAKRMDGHYRPGVRSDSWLKIKQSRSLQCVIIGYVAAGEDDFKSLIVAAEEDGGLRCVGKVGSGIDAATRQSLNESLRADLESGPLSNVCSTVSGLSRGSTAR
jgi:bifunctional non-homologous end joining protein LigD